MSNTLKIIEHLKQKPEIRFLVLTNQENNLKFGKPEIFLKDIPNEDLTSYIKNSLGPVLVPTHVWIELRIKRDNTSRKEDHCRVLIEPVPSQLPVVPTQPVQPVTMQPQTTQAQPVNIFENGSSHGNFGLGLPAIMEMHHNSSRLKDKEEQLAELKEDFKELKQEFRIQEIENRELKTKLSTSEAKEQMAVMLAKTENKPFFDSPAFEKLMDNAPQILSGIASMKSGAVTAGALGAAASEIKNELFDFINNNVDDENINFLGATAGKISNPAFKNELQLLISRYAAV